MRAAAAKAAEGRARDAEEEWRRIVAGLAPAPPPASSRPAPPLSVAQPPPWGAPPGGLASTTRACSVSQPVFVPRPRRTTAVSLAERRASCPLKPPKKVPKTAPF